MPGTALIATLEAPVGAGVTTCKEVADNKQGNCKCVAYGTYREPVVDPITGKKRSVYRMLCDAQELPVVVGGKDFTSSTGGNEMAKALALPPPMDYAPVDGLGENFFTNVFDMNMIKPAAVVLGGGAVGGITWKYANKVSWFDADWKKALLAAGLGFGVGRALWGSPMVGGSYRRDLAKGYIGAMGAIAGEHVATWLEGMLGSGASKSEETAPEKTPAGLRGGNSHFQLADADVESEHSFADVDVTADNPLAETDVSSWIS